VLNQITPLILTYNEAANIGRTLEQLRWAKEIVVVDSFSSDRTLEIVENFPQVSVFQRVFDNFASQANFGLTETEINTDWVLSLDADYVLSPELIGELTVLEPEVEVKGFRAPFTYCINGKPLQSGIYPAVTVLFRRTAGKFVADGHAHRIVLNGPVRDLSSSIFHDDRKPLKRWLQSQLTYARLEAEKLLRSDPQGFSTADRIRRWRLLAPLAICLYCLIWRGGFFDGRAGIYYALQRAFAELLLSLYLLEHDLNGLGEKKNAVPEQNQKPQPVKDPI